MPEPLSAPPERIERAINKVGRLVLYLLLLVGLVEAASWVTRVQGPAGLEHSHGRT